MCALEQLDTSRLRCLTSVLGLTECSLFRNTLLCRVYIRLQSAESHSLEVLQSRED